MAVINLIRLDTNPYAQIPNHLIRDPRLTSNAFRILAYLMSHKDGYELTYDQITRQTTLKEAAINSARDLLTDLGLITWSRPQRTDGKFAAIDWVLLDITRQDETVWFETERDETSLDSVGDNKNNNSENTNVKNKTFKRKTFSFDWQPDENQLAKIKNEYPSADIAKQVQLMIDYIVANGKEKQVKDMAARFRIWMEHADTYAKGALSKDPYDGYKRF